MLPRTTLALVLLTLGCSSDPVEQPTPDADPIGDADALVPDADAVTDAPNDGDVALDVDPDAPPPSCELASGSGTAATNKLVDGADEATVTVSGEPCRRTYALATTQKLRDDLPGNPRTVVEEAGKPFVRTKNDLFDALYALAIVEAKENSVESIQDGAFDSGKPLPCKPGGCFETGRLWKYVWTRDTAYSVDLGLAAIDPVRAKNSLEFKLSERRSGGDLQIVQDTGSGGSYPVSSDRVVWALGAMELLGWLDGDERTAFRDRAYEAMKNTVEHDRKVVYDEVTGLYRGEQSFLDWREQSYPRWTENDTVHLGMSEALSTNAGHVAILDAASKLAAEKGDTVASGKYAGWAKALRTAMASKLWLAVDKQWSTYRTTFLDPSAVRRFDALGTSLAVLLDVGTAAQSKDAIASYPLVARGVPVLWPQQKETPIYHNRSIWPFVTAYFARAAAKVGNDAAVDHAIWSLMRGAALNLSNMENLEMVTGKPHVDDGVYSGPVVNSQRQLWSVAGYLAMVQRIVFGVEATSAGLSVRPFVTKKLRNGLFANADSIALNDLTYRGKKVTVVVKLPPKSTAEGGAYAIKAVRLNGAAVTGPMTLTSASNRVEVELEGDAGAPGTVHVVTAVADYKNLFGPRSPSITNVEAAGANLKVTWNPNGELASEVSFDVYRDGVKVAEGLSGSTTSWTDSTATPTGPSHCYAVEAWFVSSKNHGQHSPPWCWWGAGATRVKSFGAATFTVTGGSPVTKYGRFHYEAWGDPGHEIVVPSFVATSSGEHLLQIVAGNGAGPISTGITAGLKVVEVLDGTTVVARGHLLMPHLGTWDAWRDSSFVRATLSAGKTYKIVLKHDPTSVNMSFFSHFDKYTGGTGGTGGPFSRVNVAELKVLQR